MGTTTGTMAGALAGMSGCGKTGRAPCACDYVIDGIYTLFPSDEVSELTFWDPDANFSDFLTGPPGAGGLPPGGPGMNIYETKSDTNAMYYQAYGQGMRPQTAPPGSLGRCPPTCGNDPGTIIYYLSYY